MNGVMFLKGDQIECIDDKFLLSSGGSKKWSLTEGKIYTALGDAYYDELVRRNFVDIINDEGDEEQVFVERFTLIPAERIVCSVEVLY